MAIENFTKTKAAIKIYEDLTQEEYDALTKEPHSFYLVNGVGIYKGTTLISAGANSSMDEIVEELNQAIAAKQDTLVSGTNIKTINGESILGEGNIEVAASDDGVDTAYVENEVLYIDDDTSAGGGNSGLTEDDVNNIIHSNDIITTLTNDVRELQTDKQDKLTAGENIVIEDDGTIGVSKKPNEQYTLTYAANYKMFKGSVYKSSNPSFEGRKFNLRYTINGNIQGEEANGIICHEFYVQDSNFQYYNNYGLLNMQTGLSLYNLKISLQQDTVYNITVSILDMTGAVVTQDYFTNMQIQLTIFD